MTTMTRSFALLPLAAALLVGCSDSNDSTANQTSELGPESGPAPTVLTKYDGTYLDACSASDAEDPTEGSEVVTTTITGDTGTVRILEYTDLECAVPSVPAERLIEISIAYPGGTVDTPQGTADFVDVTPEGITFDGQPLTAEQQTQANEAGAYDTFYDIVLLDGSSLFFGDDRGELDGETAETRPDTLHPVPAVRQ